MSEQKAILRKYFHGLTDEQFEEQVSEWPLNSVFGAMEEYALSVAREAVGELVKESYDHQIEVSEQYGSDVRLTLRRTLSRIESKL